MAERKSWTEYFLDMADLVSTRSTCSSRSVGAVIIDPISHNVVSTGFNGAPRGTAHCDHETYSSGTGKGWPTCRAIHAEINAIVNAAYNGVSTRGCHLYLPCTPCKECARTVINAGIEKVYAREYYPDTEGVNELERGNVLLAICGFPPYTSTIPSKPSTSPSNGMERWYANGWPREK